MPILCSIDTTLMSLRSPGTRRFSEGGDTGIVEKVRRRGCSAEVRVQRRSERRVHCLRGVKPQGPAVIGSCCALHR